MKLNRDVSACEYFKDIQIKHLKNVGSLLQSQYLSIKNICEETSRMFLNHSFFVRASFYRYIDKIDRQVGRFYMKENQLIYFAL